jgi:acyl-CoA dehydrogenase
MAVTEPTTGSDTTKIKTTAVRHSDRYVVSGQKVWISRVQHSDLMILLARTTPLADVKSKSQGMSIFLVDLHHAIATGSRSGRSATWSITRPMSSSSTTWRSLPRT